MRTWLFAAISISTITVAAASRQTAVAPAGTAVLSGVLVTGSPAQPVRRATVRLAGAAGTSARLVGTGDDGRFVFDALPAGSFTLSATRPGYVPAFYGAKHPGRGPGVPVAVAAGARVEVTLEILQGAAITGTITDAFGHPAPGIAVHAVELRASGAATAKATTDDRGMYRIFSLAPGDYLVSVIPQLNAGARGIGMGEVLSVT